ncbi:MAG: ABC transporter permease [Paracoccus sp. (in: a-proteobacteria)]|nr:ABC transporter permease [Paracoccus sp. (in: a-proteobacteria)]MDO5621245.1 ABC transporter permease [Paracoccus sp. (in: a-proteobacteria)]
MARAVMALILREVQTIYGRSAGGYVWAILEPVAGIAVLSLVFSLVLRQPALGTNFLLFYATGYLPFVMFHLLSSKIAQSVRFSKPFMGYPNVTFMDSLLARLILNTITNLVVIGLVLGGIVFLYGLSVQVNMAAIASAMLLTALLGAGIGTLNCYLMTSFPVWEQIWSILTRPLFLISGIFFLYGSMPPMARDVLWYNPLIHIVGLFRRGIYATYHAEYVSVLYVVSVGAVTLFFGLLLLVRHFRKLMEF